MTIDEKKLFYDTIANFEGFRSRPYRCPAGIFTIGYGHTKNVKPSSIVNEEEARKLLITDFESVFSSLNTFNFNLEEHELFAIADFVFNLGYGKFVSSSLFRLLNSYCHSQNSCSEYYKQLICDKIEQYVYYTDTYGVKKKSTGLIRRRKFETILFKYGEVKPIHEL